MAETLYNQDAESTFYTPSGLMFECQRCSGCCRHSPGYVFLSSLDIIELLEFMDIEKQDFFDKYLRIVTISGFHRLSFKEKPNYDCIFWSDGKCDIYDHRPLQCRSFPFWNSVLFSADSWEAAKSYCPGINKGRKHSPEEIDAWLSLRTDERIIEILPEDINLQHEILLRKYLMQESSL